MPRSHAPLENAVAECVIRYRRSTLSESALLLSSQNCRDGSSADLPLDLITEEAKPEFCVFFTE
jgi:hypothetical protein